MSDRLEVCSTAFVGQAFSLLALARLIRDHYLRLVAQATVTSARQHASWSYVRLATRELVIAGRLRVAWCQAQTRAFSARRMMFKAYLAAEAVAGRWNLL